MKSADRSGASSVRIEPQNRKGNEAGVTLERVRRYWEKEPCMGSEDKYLAGKAGFRGGVIAGAAFIQRKRERKFSARGDARFSSSLERSKEAMVNREEAGRKLFHFPASYPPGR